MSTQSTIPAPEPAHTAHLDTYQAARAALEAAAKPLNKPERDQLVRALAALDRANSETAQMQTHALAIVKNRALTPSQQNASIDAAAQELRRRVSERTAEARKALATLAQQTRGALASTKPDGVSDLQIICRREDLLYLADHHDVSLVDLATDRLRRALDAGDVVTIYTITSGLLDYVLEGSHRGALGEYAGAMARMVCEHAGYRFHCAEHAGAILCDAHKPLSAVAPELRLLALLGELVAPLCAAVEDHSGAVMGEVKQQIDWRATAAALPVPPAL